MSYEKDKTLVYLTYSLAILVIIGAVCGILIEDTYLHETENWRIQGIGQDMVDLFVVVPVLVVSGTLAYYQKKIPIFILGGTILFIMYTYAIYCFAVHFNFLFPVYCLTFSLSAYSIVYYFSSFSSALVNSWFDDKVPVKQVSVFLIFIAALFYYLWLREIIPAVVHHKVPPSLIETGLLTNPVHVLDLSLLLPGLIIISIFLLKGKPFAFFLVPIVLVFNLLMDINIGSLVIIMKQKGIGNNLFVAEMMGLLFVANAFLLYIFCRRLEKNR